jgi:hypothetical protein
MIRGFDCILEDVEDSREYHRDTRRYGDQYDDQYGDSHAFLTKRGSLATLSTFDCMDNELATQKV